MKNLIKFIFLIILFQSVSSKSYSQLSGTYVIGSGGNYLTITSAVSALINSGVNGPVIFKIKEGVYQERVIIDSINGTSDINTVTFESQTGNSFNTIIQDPVETMRISKADHLFFRNLTIKTTGSYPHFCFTLSGYINGFSINQCRILFDAPFDEGGSAIVSSAVCSDLAIENSYIDANDDALHFISSGSTSLNATIKDNSIGNNGAVDNMIYFVNFENLNIEGNILTGNNDPFGFGSAAGIILDSCRGEILISKNKIKVVDYFGFSQSRSAIYLRNINDSPVLISNNFLQGRSSVGIIKIENSSNINLFYNTFYSNHNTPFLLMTNSSSVSVLNNIYNNESSTKPILNFVNSSYNSDYNSYYYNYQYIAQIDNKNISTLSQLISLTQNDSNSVNTQIFFQNPNANDLHLDSMSILNPSLRGIPISAITDDIDGDPRDPFHPLMGADESPSLTLDLNLLIEGFYDPDLNLQAEDQLTVYLAETTPPYNFLDSSLCNVNSSGQSLCRFINGSSGTYYIVLKHRNSIETWSKAGGENLNTGSDNFYDFTNFKSQAFGNNLILKGNKYCLFSGDADQNGVIDQSDILLIFEDALDYKSGYLSTDINGDNVIDLTDLTIAYNNNRKFIHLIRP